MDEVEQYNQVGKATHQSQKNMNNKVYSAEIHLLNISKELDKKYRVLKTHDKEFSTQYKLVQK